MAVKSEKAQWGNALVKVKEHPREYKTGRVVVPTYSAQCMGTHKRKRLKKTYGSIYTMECDEGKMHEVDIQSGNYVQSVIIHVTAYVPKTTEVINAERFERLRMNNRVYGYATILMDLNTVDKGLLQWSLFYTDAEMTEGVGLALSGEEHIYIRFSN